MRASPGRFRKGLGLAAALALLAAACGNDDGESDAGTSGSTASTSDTSIQTTTTDVDRQPVPVAGFDGETIRVGILTPLTGPVGTAGTALARGSEVFFQGLNDRDGGVAGKYPVELVVEDDPTPPATTTGAYAKVEPDVVIIAQVLATPATEAILPLLEDDGLVAGTVNFDSSFLGEQHVLPIGTPYEIEAINGLAYWQSAAEVGRAVCVAHRDDPYFEAALAGAEFAATSMGFPIAAVVSFPQGHQDWTSQLDQLAACDVVVLASDEASALRLLGAAAQRGFAPRWLGLSPTFGNTTFENLVMGTPLGDYMQQHFWLIGYGPPWGDESLPGMARMLQDIDLYAADQAPDFVFARGYLHAWAVHQVLEEAARRGDLSRQGIIAAMNSLERLEFGGLLGGSDYGPPNDREPPRTNTVFRIDPATPGSLAAISDINFAADAALQFEFSSSG